MSPDAELQAQIRYQVLKIVWGHLNTIKMGLKFLKKIQFHHINSGKMSSDKELQAQFSYRVLQVVWSHLNKI